MDLLLEQEAAKRLRLSRQTLAALRRAGSGPDWIQLGGRIFYRPEALEAWVATCTHHHVSEISAVEAGHV